MRLSSEYFQASAKAVYTANYAFGLQNINCQLMRKAIVSNLGETNLGHRAIQKTL